MNKADNDAGNAAIDSLLNYETVKVRPIFTLFIWRVLHDTDRVEWKLLVGLEKNLFVNKEREVPFMTESPWPSASAKCKLRVLKKLLFTWLQNCLLNVSLQYIVFSNDHVCCFHYVLWFVALHCNIHMKEQVSIGSSTAILKKSCGQLWNCLGSCLFYAAFNRRDRTGKISSEVICEERPRSRHCVRSTVLENLPSSQ